VRGCRVRGMTKVIVMITSTVGSGVGWWLGDSYGIMTAFMLSIVGLAAGVYYGKRLAVRWAL